MSTAERILRHVAIVTESSSLQFDSLSRVSAALQKQVSRDFGPIWNIEGTVDGFSSLADVPIDYWPIIVRDDIKTPGAAGIHLDNDGQPFALVQFSSDWALTTSHELLEMLADPTGNRVIAGQSPMPGQGRVNFLVEVCDPSEAVQFGYTINGITVSDFFTPRFYDPVPAPGTRYTFTGAVERPRTIAKGGYISWHDPVSDEWFQQVFFDNKPSFRKLGKLSQREGSIRDLIYRVTPEAMASRKATNTEHLTAASQVDSSKAASEAKSRSLRVEIDRVIAGG
jgi:hypothetical protein